MFRSSSVRWILGLLIVICVLATVKFKPWRLALKTGQQQAQAREELNVGFLPVT